MVYRGAEMMFYLMRKSARNEEAEPIGNPVISRVMDLQFEPIALVWREVFHLNVANLRKKHEQNGVNHLRKYEERKSLCLVFEDKKWGPTEGPIHGAVNEYSEKIASGGLSHLFNAFVQSVIWVRKQNTDGLFDV